MQDAGRDQMQHELLAVDVHGVAGVVAALIARDRRKVRRQHVDDLALALVAPLRAQNCDVGLRHPTVYSTTKNTKITKHTKNVHWKDDSYDSFFDGATRSRSTSSSPSRVRRRAGCRLQPTIARARVRAARGRRDEFADRETPAYGINTGFGNFAEVKIPHDSLVAAAGQSAAQPCRRRRRAAAGSGRSRDDGAARQRAGQRLLRHPARDARTARRAAEPSRAPASCRRAARWARAATSRRWRIIALVLIGEGEAWHDGARRSRAQRRWRAPA